MFELAVLGLLAESDLHGYELKKRLGDLLGPWSSVSFGSLYPALARLERAGLVVAAAPAVQPTAPEPAPMSGSLGAELAAYRARGRSRPAGGRRSRKVYALTTEGREALRRLLADPGGDDRSFSVRVAFCRHLSPDERLDLFRRRHDAVAERLAGRERDARAADPYRRRSSEFWDDRLRRELAWIDDLIAAESAELPPGGDPALTTPGGSPS
jgi:DNA-binding PadR family transcriptional regulator